MADETLVERATRPGVLLIVSAVAVVVVYLYYRIAKLPYEVFEGMGVKGPMPTLFVGNSPQYRRMGRNKIFKHLYQSYGKISGIYLGSKPHLIIADPSIIHDILVKESRSFTCREWRLPGEGTSVHEFPQCFKAVSGLCTEEQTRIQQTFHSIFTPSKLRLMVPIIRRSCTKLLQSVEEAACSLESIEVWKLYTSYALESLCSSFSEGMEAVPTETASNLAKAMNAYFSTLVDNNRKKDAILSCFTAKFPVTREVLKYFSQRVNAESNFAFSLEQIIHAHLEHQMKKNEDKVDLKEKNFLQLLTDKGIQQTDVMSECLTWRELSLCCLAFLLGGYETIPTVLSYTSYLLAVNPLMQEKLHAEVMAHSKAKPTILATTRLKVLDAVIKESLRMYSPTFMITRRCTKPCKVHHLNIPTGMTVVIPIDLIHHLPQYWTEPATFKPERFMNGGKGAGAPYSFLPFGGGLHGCIGMKYALLDIKLVLFEIVKKYKFIRTVDTKVPPETTSTASRKPSHGMYLKIIRRRNSTTRPRGMSIANVVQTLQNST